METLIIGILLVQALAIVAIVLREDKPQPARQPALCGPLESRIAVEALIRMRGEVPRNSFDGDLMESLSRARWAVDRIDVPDSPAALMPAPRVPAPRRSTDLWL